MIFFSTQIHQFILFLTISIGLWLAFWVYFSGREKKINKYFFWMVLIWIFGEIIPYFVFRNIFLPREILLFLPRLEIAFIFIFFIFFYFFSIYFIKEEKKFPIFNKVIPLIAIIGAFLAIFTNLFQESIKITEEGIGLDLILTLEGKIIWLGFVISITLFIFFRFLANYFGTAQKHKLKLQYFLIGISFWITINLIFNVYFSLIQNTFLYAYFGNYSIIILFGFTAYAIVKRELFDIKIVLTSIFVSLIAVLLSFDILFLTPDFLHQVLKLLILAAFLCFGYFLIRSVLNEIKRRKELEHLTLKLERANARLKDLIDVKEEFLHITSHQLRTPLTAIRGMISMWCAGDFKKMSKKDRNEMMKRIYLSTERLNNITNDMIDAMELEGGSQMKQYNFKPVSLVKIIQNTIETLKTNFDKNNLYLNFKYPKNLPEIYGDENYLNQVFLNLVDNAQKYTSKGGVDINIKKENNFLVAEITDTGMGVSKEDEKCLFKKFSRGKRAEQFYTSGTGLGIFIAKKVIEEHNGKISVFSEGKNKGTTFKVHLPIK
jgi:signal transduction histidine kinase